MKPGQIMQTLEQEEINAVKERTNKRIPEIHVGDTVKVGVKIIEGGKERVQPYEGTVIAMRNGGINETITVRKIFQGVGVERVFLLHSPRIDSITVIRKGRVRRAKLFYLRDRVGKSTRVKQRFDRSLSAMRDDQKDD
jgi:large subunit ribosomal protein L19